MTCRCNETCMTDGECTCAPSLDAELRRVSAARHVRHELLTDTAGRVSLRITPGDEPGGEPVFGEPV